MLSADPRHGSLGFLPKKKSRRHRGKGALPQFSFFLHNSHIPL